MALDLLVNFERYSNHSIFYRTTGSFPLSVRLVETDISNNQDTITNVTSSYNVKLYINGKDLGTTFIHKRTELPLLTSTTFNTTTPSVCSISAVVFLNQEVVKTFAMSAVFVSSFPQIDLRLYPKNKINETTIKYETVDSLEESPGAFFYGEGHTQQFLLSCSGYASPVNGIWLVGNNISNSLVTTLWKIDSIPGSSFTVNVSISSISDVSASYPVAIRLYNTSAKILTSGPIITYPDMSGGARSFYPFFASTTDAYGIDNSLTYKNLSGKTIYEDSFQLNEAKMDKSPIGRFKGNIKVLTYPLQSNSYFVSPFSKNTNNVSQANQREFFLLPSTREPRSFRGYLYNPRPQSMLQTKLIGSNFNIEAVPLEENEGYWSVETGLLSTIHAYQFNLQYDTELNDSFLPPFTVSPNTYTTLTLNTSCFKEVQIVLSGNDAPTDWLPKVKAFTNKSEGVCGPLPYIKLYTPSYYFLREQKIPIEIIELPVFPYVLEQAVISTKYGSNKLILTPKNKSGFLQIKNTGEVDLKVEMVLKDINNQFIETYDIIYNNYVKIVNSLDYVNEDLYATNLTPLTLTYITQPKLSPNEWAIADNINSIIEKLYTTINELEEYTKLYKNTSFKHSWLGPATRMSILNPKAVPQTWENFRTDCRSWQSLFSVERNDSLTWLYHTEIANYKSKDPNCFQDYCLDWRWESRKTISRNTQVTWKLTRKNKSYEKRWFGKACEIDVDLLNCNIGTWKSASMSEYEPFPPSDSSAGCQIKNAIFHSKTNNIIFAHSGEINMISNDHNATWLARRSISDEKFSFQNIVGVAISAEGRVVVLDNILCRVSVLDVITKPADLSLVVSWGSYGSSTNPRGFNSPRDLHIDQNNCLWIADTGNKRVKKLTIVGKELGIFYDERFETNPPLSVCVDSQQYLHCLHERGVYVYNSTGTFLFEYSFPEDVTAVNKINTSFNRECVYITYATGVVKYFRIGQIAYYLLKNELDLNGNIINDYKSVTQDSQRNCYITVNDKILKVSDIQAIEESKASLPTSLYWPVSSLLVHKEEYIQPWVYLKSFHRLWDNIELIRSSLVYESKGCKSYTPPIHAKEDLVIGQNEIVTNSVINRLSQQIWENMQAIINYFDPDCKN